jgi:signal transduction histidine kinase
MPENALMATRARPFARRAWAEFGYALITGPLGIVAFAAIAALSAIGIALTVSILGTVPGLLLLTLTLGVARRLGALHGRLLGERTGTRRPRRRRRGPGRLTAAVRDGAGWRSVAYVVLRLPVAVLCVYAAASWMLGVVDLTYPLWWYGFRNHPPGVELSPLPVFSALPMVQFGIRTYAGTFAAAGIGILTLLLAPWLTRAAVTADRWLVRVLLAPGELETRVRDLEETRALAVEDSAARLRRLERDLHDGAQARLVALSINLGMAREKLDGDQLDPATLRDLVDSAQRNAAEAITELRDLARGIHPPALDGGLHQALSTLAARSTVPIELRVDLPVRPSAAIETIAYFCAAELLANVIKHSGARRATLAITGTGGGALRLVMTDDGHGGARPAAGSGLAGLGQRVRTVDGAIAIASPAGGPTAVTVELPLHA